MLHFRNDLKAIRAKLTQKRLLRIIGYLKKRSKTKIDKQFEYNTYIRDFFADNRGKSLDEAIKCWKYKKQLPGHNRYEKSDLDVLDK